VNTILLVAADSIRALLHQRLLQGLMLASLALTILFSILMSTERKGINQVYANDQPAATPAVTSSTNGPVTFNYHVSGTGTTTGTTQMTETDRRQLREAMDQMSSSLQAGFYGVASFGGSMVALFIFSTAVAAEIRKGTIRLTLSKPVSRTQFLLGKYLGGVAVMAGYALIASVAMFIFTQSQSVDVSPAIKWSPWLMFCRLLMLGSLAMLLSLWVHPIIASVLAYFAGNGLYALYNPLYYILPSYHDFNVFFQVLYGDIVDFKDVLFLTLYAADFVIIMLLIALWRFRTKELV
jgi:ABC-type transport system involved in multi-copper enzyme maturation permease subunit